MIIAQVGSFPLDIKNINGGIESSVFGLVESLIKMDHMVYVFDTPRKDIVSNVIERINDAIIYRYCAGKNKNNYEIASQCEQIIIDIQRIKPDVCHIHGTGYLQKKLFKILAKKGIKCIVTIHGLQNIEKKNELLQKKSLKSLLKYIFLSKSEFYIINNSKKIIVDTEYVKDEIFKYKKKKQIKYLPEIYVIPQGVNSIFYDIDNISKENNILCVGAISKRKGQLLLIQSFVLVKEIVKDAKLIIAGYISDDEYYNQLKQVIRDCNFEDDVKVQLNNTVEELSSLYQSSKLFVLHTEEESQGIVLCEAMASSLPIVSTNVGGVPHVVKNNINGLLSEYNDTKKFAENIITLLSDKNKYYTICENNKISSSKYNWLRITQQIVNIYKV